MRSAALRHTDFARQLEHVATAVVVSSRLNSLESQIAANRASHKASWLRVRQGLLVAKRAILAFALAAAFLQYYSLDVRVRIMAMRPAAYAHTVGI